MIVMIFGIISSSSRANARVRQNALLYAEKRPEAVRAITEVMYVDNC